MAFIATSARYGTGRFGIARYGAEDISKTLAGVSSTGAIQAVAAGGFEIDITERVTASLAGTGAISTVTVNIKEALASVSATGAINPSLEFSNTHSLSSVSATGHVNTVEEKVDEALLSVSATGSINTVTVHVSEALASVSATNTLGTIIPHATSNITLTGISARSEERRVGKECRSRWSPAP